MLSKLFKKKKSLVKENNYILTASLLIHAAKLDEKYTSIEKNIIKKALARLFNKSGEELEEIFNLAEKKEGESNQIIEFTKEIKNNDMAFRLKIIEILWKIIYSDGTSDNYESNLIRRVCGLLYISDRESGLIKLKIKNQQKKI